MPKWVDPDQKRAEFADASWKVIAKRGLEGATLRRVASEAGCTTGALTHYFPDRRSLLIHALRSAQRQAGARMVEASRRASSDFERLRFVVMEALPIDAPRLVEWRVWLAFWASSMNDPELADENARRYDEWRGLLASVLRPLVPDEEEADEEVAHLIALIDGVGLHVARSARSVEGIESDDGADSAAHDAADPAADYVECEEVVTRYLSRFEPDGSEHQGPA